MIQDNIIKQLIHIRHSVEKRYMQIKNICQHVIDDKLNNIIVECMCTWGVNVNFTEDEIESDFYYDPIMNIVKMKRVCDALTIRVKQSYTRLYMTLYIAYISLYLKKSILDRNGDYRIDNYDSYNTYAIELRCVCRLKDVFSEHHRVGFIDTFTNVHTGDKEMIIRAPRSLMYVIEKCLRGINEDNMSCDDIKKYILWQEDILIENSCCLYRICDRLILTSIVTF